MLFIGALLFVAHVNAEEAATDQSEAAKQEAEATKLAKMTQHPVASLISVPSRTTSTLTMVRGTSRSGLWWIMNVQPVLPVSLIDKQPLNVQLAAYDNVHTPVDGPQWQLRFQVQLLFPK